MIKQNPPKVNRGNQAKLLTNQIVEKLQKSPGQYFFIGRKTRSSWARAVAAYGKGIQITTRNNDGRDADIYLRSKA